jgi:ribosome-binding factor A
MDPARARKLADRIQQIVAEMLERRIKDPRLGFVTVTDARLTNDLRDATVYYTVYGSDGERADSAAALESAKGILRTEVGRQTGLRHTPSLTFVPDVVQDNARHIDELLAKARAKDEQVAKVAEGARHAGDANPYKADADDEEPDEDLAESDGGDGEEAGYSGS